MPSPKEELTYTQRLSRNIDTAFAAYRAEEPGADAAVYKAFLAQAHSVAAYNLDGVQTPVVERDIVSRAMIALKEFRGESQASTWFYRIATNEAKRALREFIRHRKRFGSLSIGDEAGEKLPIETEGRVENHDARIYLESLCQGLPPAQAVLVALKQEGFSLKEIAEKTGEPLGTISGRHRLVKSKLRKLHHDPNYRR